MNSLSINAYGAGCRPQSRSKTAVSGNAGFGSTAPRGECAASPRGHKELGIFGVRCAYQRIRGLLKRLPHGGSVSCKAPLARPVARCRVNIWWWLCQLKRC